MPLLQFFRVESIERCCFWLSADINVLDRNKNFGKQKDGGSDI